MANPSPSFSNEVTAVASPPVDLGFEFPPNPFEEDEAADARILPTSTASTLPLQDSIKLPVGRIQLNQGDKISESEKTETSSKESTEVVTESDSDADANDAYSESEKTEKS